MVIRSICCLSLMNHWCNFDCQKFVNNHHGRFTYPNEGPLGSLVEHLLAELVVAPVPGSAGVNVSKRIFYVSNAPDRKASALVSDVTSLLSEQYFKMKNIF
jgi:hypothetical protein